MTNYLRSQQTNKDHIMSSSFLFLPGSLALENRPFHFKIADVIQSAFSSCHGYVGYKLTRLGRASDEDVPSFLIVTREHGIILIDVVEERIIEKIESNGAEYWRSESGEIRLARSLVLDLYQEEVQSRLKNDLTLYDRKTRRAKTPILSVVVYCSNQATENYVSPEEFDITELTLDQLDAWLRGLPYVYNCTMQDLDKLYGLIEGTFIYENKNPIIDEDKLVTINDYIQKSLRTTFKQDDAQRLASMQLPPGPQRIRGLAGTGKTIVLCLKAAITHKRFEEFKILYLFNAQSLYQHVQTLISKYYTLEAKRVPDFEDKLHVFHAWGGKQKPGLYSELCRKYGLIPLTLGDARGKAADPLAYIYRDLLSKLGDEIEPEYDLILIDEAQDFPSEVFQLAFKLAKGNGVEKRIIWAYDEFQSLRDGEIKGPSELFGSKDGVPNLPDSILAGKYAGDIPKDFVLPNCYRTPRPVLMAAHGVAMGLYSQNPTEMFYHPGEWEAIGYHVNEPQSLMISAGDSVVIERPDENSRNLLESLLTENHKKPLKLIQCEVYKEDSEQLQFLKTKISTLVSNQGVAAEEIIIVNLKSGNNKEAMLTIQRALNSVGIKSVIPGYVESADVFKLKGYVTITTPFRAKGNEANIVFVINAQCVVDDFTLRMRNAYFVAVTRSRGWCYITGYGNGMEKLESEISAIKRDFPRFHFTCPDIASIQRGKSFLNKSDKELDKIQELLELIDKNPELRHLIADRIKEN